MGAVFNINLVMCVYTLQVTSSANFAVQQLLQLVILRYVCYERAFGMAQLHLEELAFLATFEFHRSAGRVIVRLFLYNG